MSCGILATGDTKFSKPVQAEKRRWRAGILDKHRKRSKTRRSKKVSDE